MPTCWWLLSNSPDTSHGHGGHDDGHGKSHDEESEPEDESTDDADGSADDKGSERSEDSDSGDDSKEADTPDTSDDEGEEPKKDGNIVKSIPDAEGGNKKRLESEKGIKEGEGEPTGGKGEPTDKVCELRFFFRSYNNVTLGCCFKRACGKSLAVLEARGAQQHRYQTLH